MVSGFVDFWSFVCVCVCVCVMDMLLVSSSPHLNAVLGPAGSLGTVLARKDVGRI